MYTLPVQFLPGRSESRGQPETFHWKTGDGSAHGEKISSSSVFFPFLDPNIYALYTYIYLYISSLFLLVCFPGLSSMTDKASAGWGEETAHSVARRPQVIATGGAEGGNTHTCAMFPSVCLGLLLLPLSYSVSSSLRWICSWFLPTVFYFFYTVYYSHIIAFTANFWQNYAVALFCLFAPNQVWRMS